MDLESQTALGRTLDLFERVSEWCGKLVSWLYAVLVLIIVYEVIARYVFNSPTKWVFDVSYMLGGAAFSIGAAWTLKVGRQVRVDIIYGRLAPRRRAIVDLVFGALFFFPLVIFAFIFSVDHAAFYWAT
ncbi:MAG: TRAP transporter small permease subunit, partial [Clostridia bacterium]|nr:TRAP transporter small permease subunit [Clostridia bacterium]